MDVLSGLLDLDLVMNLEEKDKKKVSKKLFSNYGPKSISSLESRRKVRSAFYNLAEIRLKQSVSYGNRKIVQGIQLTRCTKGTKKTNMRVHSAVSHTKYALCFNRVRRDIPIDW